MPRAHATRHGLLVAVLCAIAAVVAVGLAFQATSRLSARARAAADRTLLVARADALSRAGIAYALGSLRNMAREQYWASCGGGTGYPTTRADEPRPTSRWSYTARVADPDAWYDDVGAGLPLDNAAFPPQVAAHAPPCVYGIPSYYRGNPGAGLYNDPVLATYSSHEIGTYVLENGGMAASGRGRPISGWIGGTMAPEGPGAAYTAGTYENLGDTYALKILDCASMVNVNMDTAEIERFLDLLGEEVDHFFRARFTKDGHEVARSARELASMGYRYPGLALATSTGLGTWLIPRRDARPDRRFGTKAEIEVLLQQHYGAGAVGVEGLTLAGPDVAREDWAKLRDFITCHGYRDRTVLEPGSLMTNQLYAALDRTRPDREARSPIDLNTASNPVLTAWLRGLAYHRYDEARLALGDGTSVLVDFDQKFGCDALRRVAFAFRRAVRFTPVMAWLGLEELLRSGHAEHLAGDVVENGTLRGAFDEALARAGLDASDREAWVAMANPNAMLNKFGPDASVRRGVDKYDLAHGTTELAVGSMGYYEIESRGAITANGGRALAVRTIRGVYQVYDQVVRTTQRDFELDRLTHGPPYRGEEMPLQVDGMWSVASVPETRSGYSAYAEDAGCDSANPADYGYAATYDGALCHGAIERRTFAKDELALGFSSPPGRNPHPGKNELDALTPAGPTACYVRTPTGLATARAVATDTGPRLRIAIPDDERPLRYDRVATGGPAALARFQRGSDAFPFGLHVDALRRRALVFDAGAAAGPQGAIRFWVQPDHASALVREDWISWRDELGQSVSVCREGALVRARFDLGGGAGGELFYDTALASADWAGGTWHEVYVDWDRAGRLFVDGYPPTGGGRDSPADSAATAESPRARHVSFSGYPPEVEHVVMELSRNPALHRAKLEWIAREVPRIPRTYGKARAHESLWIGHGGPGVGDHFANATIDNVVVSPHLALGFSRATARHQHLPALRFREWPKAPVRAIYWQDISAHFSGYGRDLELGALLWNTSISSTSRIELLVRVGDDEASQAPGG